MIEEPYGLGVLFGKNDCQQRVVVHVLVLIISPCGLEVLAAGYRYNCKKYSAACIQETLNQVGIKRRRLTASLFSIADTE